MPRGGQGTLLLWDFPPATFSMYPTQIVNPDSCLLWVWMYRSCGPQALAAFRSVPVPFLYCESPVNIKYEEYGSLERSR
jgi:hypothetical protein